MPQAISPRINKPVIRDIESRFYFPYSVSFATLTPGTTQQGTIRFHSDSDFELIKLVVAVYKNTAGTEGALIYEDILMGIHYPGITVLITDNDSGTQMMDIATPLSNIFGTAQQPFTLPQTEIFNANSTLSFQVSNLYTAETIASITLTLVGRKIYRTAVGA